MKQYIEWGVDGIITDRPDLIIKVLADLGFK
jgi:glycerophosphoryl diester phosphodiesterase